MDEIGYTVVDEGGRPIARRATTAPSWRGGGTSPGAIRVYEGAREARAAAKRYGGKIAAVLVCRIDDPEYGGFAEDEVW